MTTAATPLARPATAATAGTSATATASAPAALAAPAAPAATVEIRCPQGWIAVCTLDDLTPGRGVAALLPDGTQAALFVDRAGQAYAIANRDPFTGAQVLSRGLTGSAGGRAFVASPLLKQRFDLVSGDCLDDPEVAVAAYPVRTRGGEHDC
ncbi:nitrite reductase small subunit NirD [Streptomyces sp. NPDC015125]|uniref:nitrite reductase small subunit NirD n=1 Tax=Streptomyces sp. NPDC015125 TaxID=3364938 RepID=UPI0036FB927E